MAKRIFHFLTKIIGRASKQGQFKRVSQK